MEQQWYLKSLRSQQSGAIGKTDSVIIDFYFPDARKTDLTNKSESIMDLLVDSMILEDDNHVVVPKLILRSKGIDKKNPRAEITILYRKRAT